MIEVVFSIWDKLVGLEFLDMFSDLLKGDVDISIEFCVLYFCNFVEVVYDKVNFLDDVVFGVEVEVGIGFIDLVKLYFNVGMIFVNC